MATSMIKLLGATAATYEVQDNAGTAQILLDGTVLTFSTAERDQRALSFDIVLGTADDQHIVIPWACTVTAIHSVIDVALATADEVLTFKNNAGTGLTGGVITVTQSGSADGDIDSVTPTANNAFTAGQKLTVSIGGQNTVAANCQVTILIDIT